MQDNPLFRTFLPKKFCKEFVEAKGNSLQLGLYMALVLGLKPLMDDWIPVGNLKKFKKACRRYGIYLREDVIFKCIPSSQISDNIIGREILTTTSAYGKLIPKRHHSKNISLQEQVHVFLSKDKNLLTRGMWYPVIVKDRVIPQPRFDSLMYGYVLGYPQCCIKFFREFNNWRMHSYLYQAYKHTIAQPHYLCNPFLKDTSFAYIYHMPCNYRCLETIKLARKIRREIKKREPDYVNFTDYYLKKIYLVFYEKKYYWFEGNFENNVVVFKKMFFCSPDKDKDVYSRYFVKADALSLKGRRIYLYKKRNLYKIINVPLNEFAPEYPFIIKFGE